ncbi:hypothetical protein FIBSPDRAFT_942684 [Athelia psychrophila]|uniref:Uncharacterized protein n=1 Tax=Athelia psychrophila TaxID=1759441 RepID=A0A166XA46_9AGAM|nr:hypothetical protein FIBSPDRAFT_942684 [Fibularhizoctonia sp. CBS 109695]
MGPKRPSATELRERVTRAAAVKAAQSTLDAFLERVGDPETAVNLVGLVKYQPAMVANAKWSFAQQGWA